MKSHQFPRGRVALLHWLPNLVRSGKLPLAQVLVSFAGRSSRLFRILALVTFLHRIFRRLAGAVRRHIFLTVGLILDLGVRGREVDWQQTFVYRGKKSRVDVK
jgi:hypothetical protein